MIPFIFSVIFCYRILKHVKFNNIFLELFGMYKEKDVKNKHEIHNSGYFGGKEKQGIGMGYTEGF